MIAALIKKELTALAPFLVLIAVLFFGADVFFWCFAMYPDQSPINGLFDVIDPQHGDMTVYLTFGVAFAISLGLVASEHDQKTLEFLDALPTTRTHVFAVKCALAVLIVAFCPLLKVLVGLMMYTVLVDSQNTTLPWNHFATAIVLGIVESYVFVSFSLVLSFLGRFALITAALIVGTFFLLEHRDPSLATLDMFALATPRFVGAKWVVPGDRLAILLVLASGGYALAWWLFRSTGEPLIAKLAALKSSWRMRSAYAASLALAVILWLVLGGRWANKETKAPQEGEAVYPRWGTATTETKSYTITYPANMAKTAHALADRADDVQARVATLLDASPLDGIQVDATQHLLVHSLAGVAEWKHVDLDLSASEELDVLAAILAHETTHVYIDALSELRLRDHGTSARFFHEGLATFVELRFTPDETRHAHFETLIGLERVRKDVKFDQLFDDRLLTSKYSAELAYILGDAFATALVDRYGDAAPGRVLRAFARADAPKDLEGIDLWRDTLQAAGYNLDEVAGAYDAVLARCAKLRAEEIKALPPLIGAMEEVRTMVGIKPSFEGAQMPPWRIIARFRRSPEDPPARYFGPEHTKDGIFFVRRALFAGGVVSYQLGYLDPVTRLPSYQPWVEQKL